MNDYARDTPIRARNDKRDLRTGGSHPARQSCHPFFSKETHHVRQHPHRQQPTSQAEESPIRRDAKGHFVVGNPGGPGNPFARQTAALRKALLDSVTAKDIQEIAGQLTVMAKMGNLAAAKLLFSYVIGKPQPAVEPDNLDAQEWERLKSTAFVIRDLPRTFGPGLDLPLMVAREARPGISSDITKMFAESMCKPEEFKKKMAELYPHGTGYEDRYPSVLSPSTNGMKRPKPPSTNGSKRPSANGKPVAV